MRLVDGTLRLSPTDLGNHLACPHLTQLELRVQRGELERPHVDDAYGRIIMDKGNEHEAAYLARLEEDGSRVARMLTYDDEDFDEDEARRATEDAIRAGEVVPEVGRRQAKRSVDEAHLSSVSAQARTGLTRRARVRRDPGRSERPAPWATGRSSS